jgi:tetratricopeptide (TPR) repeat protein
MTIISIVYIDGEQELLQAQQAFNQKDMDQSLRMARRANISFSDPKQKIDAYYLQAKAATKMNRVKTAKSYLDQILMLDQNNTKGLLFRGKILVQLGENEKAIDDLNKGLILAIGKFGKQSMAYYRAQRGYAYLALKQGDNAKKDAEVAINLKSKLPEPHDLMSRILEQHGDIKGALEQCEVAYQLSSAHNKLFFTTPKGRKLSDRRINLKVKYTHQTH